MKGSNLNSQRRGGLRACVTAAAIAMATPAFGGIVDSPVPKLDGDQAEVVFYVPGVQSTQDHGDYRNLDTLFTCTSLENSKTIRFSVEVFQSDGTGPVGNWLPNIVLIPGQTASVSTNNVVAYMEDDRLDLESIVPGGAARIIATSKKIMCSAVLARTAGDDAFEDAFMQPSCNLRVVRNNQKGD